MAIIKNGNISGKLGRMVGYMRDGENVVRMAPQRTAPPTEKELINQYIFRLVQQWVTPLTLFLKRGFRNYSRKVYGANAAKSLIHRHALHRDGYNSTIDASLVQVSAGKVALPRDRIMLLAYNVEKKWPEFELSGPKRLEGTALLPLSGNIPGTYHLYAAFVSEDGEEQSESRYLGEVEIV